jgi:hypothetical protein
MDDDTLDDRYQLPNPYEKYMSIFYCLYDENDFHVYPPIPLPHKNYNGKAKLTEQSGKKIWKSIAETEENFADIEMEMEGETLPRFIKQHTPEDIEFEVLGSVGLYIRDQTRLEMPMNLLPILKGLQCYMWKLLTFRSTQ